MVWYILLGIAALLLVILYIPLSLTVMLDESGALRLVGRALGIAVYRSPKKERPVHLSDYTPRALRRRERREQKRRRRALKRQQRKQASRGGRDGISSPPDKRLPLTEKLGFIKDLAEVVFKRSLRYARVDVERLTVTVATPDAAQTAILYGAVCAALAGVTEALNVFSHIRIRHPEAYGVAADFTSEKTRADIRLHFRLRVHHVLSIAWHTLRRLVSRMLQKKK